MGWITLKHFMVLYMSFLIFSKSPSDHQVPSNKFEKIDQLFEQYQHDLSPGYALGIIQNEELIYSKGYGFANLEYDIPLSDSSAFYIGSMAKQFTAAALLILESEGKLDFEHTVQHYLPEFPSYKSPITIKHLVHHTSGIRETNSMQLFQGIDTQFEEVFDTDDLYKLVCSQEELNFQPGQEYRYSSGGYAVLAKLVERISGQSFRSFLKERIFAPLGMQQTLVSDDHNEIVRNRAVSYWPIGPEKFERRTQVFDAYGDGGIITSVKDLVQWDKAFYEDLLGVDKFADKMYQKGFLNSGKEIEYARALQVRSYRSQKMITHNGGMLGFRVDLIRFPDLKTSIILLSNHAYAHPSRDALKVADILLDKDLKDEREEKTKPGNRLEVELSTAELKKRTGYYWTDEVNYFRRIIMRNDSLFFDNGNANGAVYLKPISSTEFTMTWAGISSRLLYAPNGKELEIYYGDTKRCFRKFDPTPPQQIADLKDYIGTYHSKELSSQYDIYQEVDTVYLSINRNKPQAIFPLPAHTRMVWNGHSMLWIGFGEIKFERDKNGSLDGFRLGDGRVSGVYFEKL